MKVESKIYYAEIPLRFEHIKFEGRSRAVAHVESEINALNAKGWRTVGILRAMAPEPLSDDLETDHFALLLEREIES